MEVEVEVEVHKLYMQPNNKYCIFKGVEGFGDRLQCLLQAIQYCEYTNRILIVDWRDKDWIQDQNESIEDYFEIQKIKTISIENFFIENNKQLTVSPNIWIEDLNNKDYQKFIYKNQYNHEDNSIFNEIINNKIDDFNEEIVVYPGVRKRFFKYRYWNYIKFDSTIYSEIQEVMNKYNLKENQYNCIHIRSQNKNWTSGITRNENLRKRINKKFINQSMYFRYLQRRHKDLNSKLKTIIISDNQDCSHFLNENYFNSQCIIIEANKEKIGELCGIHKKIFEDKNKKREINIKTIVDFHLMIKSQHIISDGISLYSNMARNLQINDKS